MVNTLYAELRGVASDLLKEFDQSSGTDVTDRNDGIWYVEETPGTGPADDPGEPVPTYNKVDGVARGAKFKYVDGTNILASDLQAVIPADKLTPNMRGYMLVNGTRYKIIRIDTVPPSGTAVIHRVFYRK